MNVLFFLYTILMAALVYNLWRPVYSPANVALVSFMFGLLLNLFALHFFVVHTFITLLYLSSGPQGWSGNLGMLLALGAGLGLVLYHLRSYTTREQVEAALQEGLGADYKQQILPELRAQFPNGLHMRRIFWPFPQDLPGVEIVKDISYGEGIRRLDIYRKRGHGSRRPVLLQIHGGAWTENMGSKNEQARPLMNHLALRDWICVSAGYRLSPGATMPEHIVDVKNALLWIKQHIAEYGGDPDFVVATGGSAGGHLSALLALTVNDDTFQPGAEGQDTTVQGCVPFYGAVDLLNDGQHQPNDNLQKFLADSVIKQPLAEAEHLWTQLSPLRRVHAQAPPFFVICGDKDTLVPVATNSHFASRLAEVSGESVCYAQIEGAQHAFDLTRTPHSENVVFAIERWLAFQYSRYLGHNG